MPLHRNDYKLENRGRNRSLPDAIKRLFNALFWNARNDGLVLMPEEAERRAAEIAERIA